MEKLLGRLDESSNSNIVKMNGSMVVLIEDVGRKMAELSAKMSDSVQGAMENSSRAVNEAVRTTDKQSSAILAKLNSLLGNIETRSEDFREAGKALVQAQDSFRQTLTGNEDAMKRLQDVSDKLRTAALSIAETARQSKDTENLQSIAAERLSTATKTSAEVFGRLDQLLDRQQRVLETLDERLRNVMAEIGSGLDAYTQSVKDNFENISRVGNELIPPITQAVQSQVESLVETIEELTSVLKKSIGDLER